MWKATVLGLLLGIYGSLQKLQEKIERMAGQQKQALKDAEEALRGAIADETEEVKRFVLLDDAEDARVKQQLADAEAEIDILKSEAVGEEDVAAIQGLVDTVKAIFTAPNVDPLPEPTPEPEPEPTP